MNIKQIKAAFEVHRPGLAPEVQFLFDSMIVLNEQLENRIQKLENQLAKDSHNSSKPQSSDPPKVKRTKSLRTNSKNNLGGLPEHIRHEVGYGGGIKALGVYLQCHHHLPMERACQMMSDLFGFPISQSSLANFTKRAYDRLSAFEQGLRDCILRSKSAFFDETGLRLLKKNHWIHTASTLKHALFQVHARRGGEALEEIGLLAQYEGVAHHDAYSSYFGFKRYRHSLCNAHSLRDLIFVEEQFKQCWQGRFRKEYRQLLSQGLEATPPPKKIPGKSGKMPKTYPRNLLERLQKRENDYLRFMYDPDAFFDNNQAERDLRMNKVKMKISGCFRSFEAAKTFARIRSFLLTAQKQSVNVLEALKDVFSPPPVFYLNLITLLP